MRRCHFGLTGNSSIVMIGDVDSYRIDPIFTVQSVDYRSPDMTSGMALIAALHERAGAYTNLPDPLPEPPPIPYAYLQRLGVAIDSPEELSPIEQSTMLVELRRVLRDEDDDSVREDIRRLLRALRRRSEVTHAAVAEIDDLLVRPDAVSGNNSQRRDGIDAEVHFATNPPGLLAADAVRSRTGATPPRCDDAARVTGPHADTAEASVRKADSLDQAGGSSTPSTTRRRMSTKTAAVVAGAVVVVAFVAIVGFLLVGRTSRLGSTDLSVTASPTLTSTKDGLTTTVVASAPTVATAPMVATVTADVDVYDQPDGIGNLYDGVFLHVGQQLVLVEPCRDNWCHLLIPEAPGGEGWVYQDGFLQIAVR